MLSEIQANIVAVSVYRRKLALTNDLKALLAPVAHFKAMHKLDAQFYVPQEKGRSLTTLNDRAKTSFRYYVKKGYSKDLHFCFYRDKPGQYPRDELYFEIAEKNIPAIIEGLEKEIVRLKESIPKEHEPTDISEYSLERLIRDAFSGREYTVESVHATKFSIVETLRKTADKLERARMLPKTA